MGEHGGGNGTELHSGLFTRGGQLGQAKWNAEGGAYGVDTVWSATDEASITIKPSSRRCKSSCPSYNNE